MQAPIEAVRFRSPDYREAERLTREEWKKSITFCDRTQLTLPLALRARDHLPEEVRARFDRNLSDNAERWQRIQAAYREIADPFDQAGVDFAVLKGFSHCPCFVRNPRWRPQYDIDLLLPRTQLIVARDVAASLGYEPLRRPSGRVDHLPTMIRKTGWEWRGDLFDPEIPVSLELHFRLWDPETEQFGAARLDEFWGRRECRVLEGLPYTAFHPVDAAGYACLHLLRHLLRGSLKVFHVYELASLLQQTAGAEGFWSNWQSWHDPSVRRLEAICFALAQRWFDCGLSPEALEEVAALSPDIVRWLDLFAFSPIAGLAASNKDELWLHWSLIDSTRGRWSMLRRRLIPELPPGPVDAVHLPERDLTWPIRIRRKWRYLSYSSSRALHHAAALPGLALSAARWFGGLTREYWTFFCAAALFNFGLFVFFLLYNIYLLRLGFHENFLGLVSGVMTAGSVVACIPAAAAIRRFGMKPALMGAFVAIACAAALRATVTGAPALIGLAFVAGFFGVFWGVAISPAVAQLTTERNRSLGFSLIMASGVGIGVIAGFIGGRLPGHFGSLLSSDVAGFRAALFCGCAMVLLALWPLSRVKLEGVLSKGPVLARPSQNLLRFFAAIVVWNVATGIFNPFFSAFFVHLRFSTERIGELFSSVHFIQAIAMLAGPIAFQRLGLVRSVSAMQFATALSLAALAMWKGVATASVAYGAYTVFQYMSEPGLFAWLMNSVPESQRAGVSALNMIVILGSQMLVATASGVLITRFGYSPVLGVAALLSVAAALLFRGLGAGRIAQSDP